MNPEKYNLIVVTFDPIWLLNATHSFSSQSHSVSSSPPMLKWHSFCSKWRVTAARQESGRCAARFKRKKRSIAFALSRVLQVGKFLVAQHCAASEPRYNMQKFPE